MKKLDKGSRGGFAAVLLILWLGIGVVGCNSLLDVENPNNVVSEDVELPSAAQPLANGALFTLQGAWAYSGLCNATLSDELHWVGSRDAYQQLNFGHADFENNEFTDQAYIYLGPARWHADNAVTIIEGHYAANELTDSTILAEAYLWAGLTYGLIADHWDNFTFSDMMIAGDAIGTANMGGLYTTAIGYMNSALALSGVTDAAMLRNLTAQKAKLQHSQGVWNMLGVRPITTGPLSAADAATAAATATEALLLDASDWVYELEYFSSGTYPDFGQAINGRQEMRFGNNYITPTPLPEDKTRDRTTADRGIALQDPIDAIGDPRLDVFMTVFEDDKQYADLPILSARQMHLILAEDAMVNGGDFATHINYARNLASPALTAWTAGSGVSMQDMLIYERQVNLFVMGSRLNDMYRFGIQGDMWQVASVALNTPGTLFPITRSELDANCFLNPLWPADSPCGS
jgi:hypothetical protein